MIFQENLYCLKNCLRVLFDTLFQSPRQLIQEDFDSLIYYCICLYLCSGDVAVDLTDERGVDVPIKTIDNKDGTFTVEYEPKTPGVYTAMIYFAEQEIPQSPIKVKVEPSIDTSGIKVEGLEPSKISLYCVFCSFLFLSIMYYSLFFSLTVSCILSIN